MGRLLQPSLVIFKPRGAELNNSSSRFLAILIGFLHSQNEHKEMFT